MNNQVKIINTSTGQQESDKAFKSALSCNHITQTFLWSNFNAFDVFIVGATTSTVSLGTIKRDSLSAHHIFLFESTLKEPFDSFNENLLISCNLHSVSNRILEKIKILDVEEKKHEAIKEVHKLFDILIKNNNITFIDALLNHASKINFSLAVLIAILSATVNSKSKLLNRITIFNNAEAIAIKKVGEEKLKKSVFYNLK